MDIEELNKSQIIFLTLLVSFVTSIATGIVTVSLMQQAPQGITQTVNRIVERTVEKVIPEPAKNTPAAVASAPAKQVETTVVVKEDDLAADSIAKVQTAVVKIVEKGGSEGTFYARGVIISDKGIVATDRSVIDPNLGSEAILSNGLRFPITFRAGLAGDAVLIADLDFTATTTPTFGVAPLADIGKIRLGQGVIRIGGRDHDAVAPGVVSSTGSSDYIETNVTSTVPGSVLITIFGEVVGLTTGKSLAQGNTFFSSAKDISVILSR